MNKKPLVTVIIPVYNKALYLKECLNSVLTQSYGNIEIICVDDGSTDDSAAILENYAKNDNRIRLYKTKHLGVSEARNTGIRNARGDYMHFLDADDLIKPGTYQKIIDFLNNSNRNVELISFFYDIVSSGNETNNQIHKNSTFNIRYGEKENIVLQFLESPQESMLYGGGFTVSTKLMKTNVIKENNLSFDKNNFSEDNDFCFSFLLHCNFVMIVPDDFYVYRIVADSLSSKKQNKYDVYELTLKTFYKLQDLYIELGERVYCAFCDAMINCVFFEYKRTSDREIRLKNINEITEFKFEISKRKECLAIIDKYRTDFDLVEYNNSALISNVNQEQLYNNELASRISIENKYNSIINSKIYKFGIKLFAPYRKFRKLIKRNNR